MKLPLLDAIKERPLLADGAMGTQLMLAGLERGACGEYLNVSRPDRVTAIQRSYVEAGSDCLLTNTFGANRIALQRHGMAHLVTDINSAGMRIARGAFAAAGRDGYVIGDICPFAVPLELHEVCKADVRAAFEEQACALVDAGADAIIVETQTSLEELVIGIDAAVASGAACVIASMAFDVSTACQTFRTMRGVDLERAAEVMVERGAHIVGFNCGNGMDMPGALAAVRAYARVTGLPIMAQPNAGQPRRIYSTLVYDGMPDEMMKGVVPLLKAGARVVGGCCGTTPEHIRAFRVAIDRHLAGGSTIT